jgi:hypothetical protein
MLTVRLDLEELGARLLTARDERHLVVVDTDANGHLATDDRVEPIGAIEAI